MKILMLEVVAAEEWYLLLRILKLCDVVKKLGKAFDPHFHSEQSRPQLQIVSYFEHQRAGQPYRIRMSGVVEPFLG